MTHPRSGLSSSTDSTAFAPGVRGLFGELAGSFVRGMFQELGVRGDPPALDAPEPRHKVPAEPSGTHDASAREPEGANLLEARKKRG